MTQQYEYQVVPAPTRSARFKGLKRKDDAFSLTVSELMNALGRDGWDYVRADRLSETRGIWPFRRRLPARDLLVFRRATRAAIERRNEFDVVTARIKARKLRDPDVVAAAASRKIEIGTPINTIAAE